MANTPKYFLDLTGLTALWNKIKATFADKEQTQTSINDINSDIADLDTRLQIVDSDVNDLETTVLTIAPREVNYYADAVEASKSLAVGTTIKVNYPETSAEDATPSGYSTGIYIVTGVGEIKFLSVSDGDADASDITALGERVTSLEDTVVKSAEIVDEQGRQLGQTYSVTNNVLLVAHDDTFDIDSESVKSLTHRAVAAKFRDIENSLTQIPKFKVAVVDELPTEEISLSTIYLLRNDKTYDKNLFTEYIYVEHTVGGKTTYAWEKLGEQTLIVEDIVTNSQLNEVLSNTLSQYSKTHEIKEFIKEANDNLKLDILKTVEETYATIESVEEISKEIENISGDLSKYLTKEDAATNYLTIADAANTYLTLSDAETRGWVTEDDVLTSIQSGNIGNAIIITEEQIEQMIADNQ
jgi:hypothetical protein